MIENHGHWWQILPGLRVKRQPNLKASLRFRDDIDVSPVPVDDDVITDIQSKERVFQPPRGRQLFAPGPGLDHRDGAGTFPPQNPFLRPHLYELLRRLLLYPPPEILYISC